jgi:hypothetical protein
MIFRRPTRAPWLELYAARMKRSVLAAVLLLVACGDESKPKPRARAESGGASTAQRTSTASRAADPWEVVAPSKVDLPPLRPALEAAPAPATPPKASTQVGFDWGPPCRVPAVQDVEKKGKHVRLAFEVVLERESKRLVARLENMRVLAPNDRDLQRFFGQFESAIPPIAVATTGEGEGPVDIERAIEALLRLVPEGQEREAMTKIARNPQFRAAFEQKATETWNAWVGTWVGLDIAPNTTERDHIDLETAMGTFKDVPIKVTHHGTVRDSPDLVLLSIEQTIEGPQLVTAMRGFMQAAGAPTVAMDRIKGVNEARKIDLSTIAIDPVHGRPHRARHETEIALGDQSQREVRDTAFDWSRATGCVAH